LIQILVATIFGCEEVQRIFAVTVGTDSELLEFVEEAFDQIFLSIGPAGKGEVVFAVRFGWSIGLDHAPVINTRNTARLVRQ